MLIKRDWKYCAVVMLLVLATTLGAGFSGQLVSADQVGGGGSIPTITLNVPASAVPGGAVSVTGSIYNNGPEAGVPLGLTVKDANGAICFVGQTTSAADGAFGFDFAVPAIAPAGTWTVDVAGGGTVGHEVFTVANAPAPVLTRVTLNGPIPDLTVGGVVYDLNNLTRAGYDQSNNPYDISSFQVTWQIASGAGFVSLSVGILSPVSPGTGTVTATIGGVVSDPVSFTVNPGGTGGSNLFVQVTDMHLSSTADAVKYLQADPGYNPEAYAAQFVNEMKSLQPSFVVNTGDLVALADSKKLATGATGLAWYQLYNNDVAQPLKDAGIPLYNVSGNHDLGGTNYYTGPDDPRIPVDLKVYYGNGLFTAMTGSQRYYSFDQGDYHYIALDPDETGNSSSGVNAVRLPQEQLTWLQQDLPANRDKNIILFFHQPSSDWLNWADVASILKDYKIKMIFDGHWHLNAALNSGFPEQSTSSLCGSWWRYPVGKDGSPFGYRLVYTTPDGVRSFFKDLGRDQQIDLIAPAEIAIGGQVNLYAQAYDGKQGITAMQYRIDGGAWQPMSLEKVAVWYEGRATLNVTPDGAYHRIEVSYVGADGNRFSSPSSPKLFKFDANPVIDIKDIKDNFDNFRGRYATVAATVTAAFAGGSMPVLQDQTDAMPAWTGDCAASPALNMGSVIRLRGQVTTDGEVYGTDQLQLYSPADVTGAEIAPIASPQIVTIPDVAAKCYQLVKIQGVKVTEIDDSSDFDVVDQNQNKLLIYTGDQSPAFDARALHVGETLDISGIAWLYNGDPEICTRTQDDLALPATLAAPVKIAVFSDPHYYDTSLGTSGAAWQQLWYSDFKMRAESASILDSTINAIKSSDAQIVLVTGDLTNDGELICHQGFASKLEQLKAAGKKVYVIDGNHDINNYYAASYSGSTATPVAHISMNDFKSIYHDFGYDEAVAVDPYSLSYAVDPVPGLRIICMDSALYANNSPSGNPSETGGSLEAVDTGAFTRLDWIDQEIADGVAKGDTVIGMEHHPLTDHFVGNSQFFPDFVLQDAANVTANLASHGMHAVFTGHFHTNDVTKVPNQDLFDIETGALVTYPAPYRYVELTPDNQLKVTTQRATSINYNPPSNDFQPYINGTDFQTYAKNTCNIQQEALIPYMLASVLEAPPYNMPAGNATTVGTAVYTANNAVKQMVAPGLTVNDLISNALLDNRVGDESPSQQTQYIYSAMINSGISLNALLGSFCKNLDSDLSPPDNNVGLNLNTGQAIGLVADALDYQMAPGGTHRTVITFIDSNGSRRDVTSQATYTSSNPAAATVNPAGQVDALAFGNTVVTAIYGGSQASVNVTVANFVPNIILSVPDTVAQGGAVHVTGSISSNGPMAGVAIGITVNDVNGAICFTDQTTSAADGSFSFDFTLPADAALGTWQVSVAGGGTIADQTFTVTGGTSSITVSSVASIGDITVPYGTAFASLSLPATVTIHLSDGASPSAQVAWGTVSSPAYDGNTAGAYTFTGTPALPDGVTNPNNIKAMVKVIVQQQSTQPVTVASVRPLGDISVSCGTAFANVPLPASVTLTLSDGSKISNVPVVWDGGTPTYNKDTAGTYAFTGTLNLPAGVINPDNVMAMVNVHVISVPVVGGDHKQTIDLSGTVDLATGGSLTLDLANILPASALQVNGTTNMTFNDALDLTLGSGVNLSIPAGTAVSGAGALSVQNVDPGTLAVAPPGNAAVISFSFGDAEVTFSKPVTITIPATTAGAHAYYYRNSVWIDLGAPVSVTGTAPNCVLTYDVTHFTNFTSATPLSGTLTFNPASGATISSGSTVTLSAPAGAAKILYYFSATAPGADFGSGSQPTTISGASGATVPITSNGYIAAVFVDSHNATSQIFTAQYAIRSSNSSGGGGGAVITAPGVQTADAASITGASATLNGSITASGGTNVTAYGFLWGTGQNNLDQKQQVGTDNHSGSFQASLSGLKPETTYYFRAYATNSQGTTQGSLKQFTTVKASTQQPQPPVQPVPAQSFTDVPASHWGSAVIADLSSKGYISGYPDGSFHPDGSITRAELVSIIGRSLKLPAYSPATASFSDVSLADWFYNPVEQAAHAGIVKGDGTSFAPDRPVTREELACILVNALGKQDEAQAGLNSQTGFSDDAVISAWARGSVSVAAKDGLIKGYQDDHSFRAQHSATRAEACAMIGNFLGMQQ